MNLNAKILSLPVFLTPYLLTKPRSLVAALLFLPLFSQAAVPVTESSGEPGYVDARQQAQMAKQKNTAKMLGDLYLQIQQLQSEVDALKGTVELQQFKLDQLNEKRLQDYINLDKRLAELGKPGGRNTTETVKTSAGSASQDVSGKELERYKAAQALARKGEFAQASQEFELFIKTYPESRYVPSAMYWLADSALQQQQQKQAADLWSRLIEQYPKHHKAPAAHYKLAQIEFEQGKKSQAKQRLKALVANPASQKGVVALAKAYLKANYSGN